MVRWSDLRDGVDIHEVLYTGPLVYLCMCVLVCAGGRIRRLAEFGLLEGFVLHSPCYEF